MVARTPLPGVCRACGCTDWRACEGGCWWVEDDLCSTCDRRIRHRNGALLALALVVFGAAAWAAAFMWLTA